MGLLHLYNDEERRAQGRMEMIACIYSYMLLLSTVEPSKVPKKLFHDGFGKLRKGRVPRAAAKRLLGLWLDPNNR